MPGGLEVGESTDENTGENIAENTGDDGYSGPEVCRVVGITYRQLDYWARTDLVRPSLADARGSGTQRRYSYQDLVRLKVVKSLLDAGVKLQAARSAIDYLRDDLGEAQWETASLVLDGSNSVLARDGDQLVDLVRLKVVKSLLDAGVKLQAARKAIDYLRDDLGEEWETASLVLDGGSSVLARDGDALVDLVRHGQGVLNIVPLGSMVHEIDAAIVELAAPPESVPARRRRAAQGS